MSDLTLAQGPSTEEGAEGTLLGPTSRVCCESARWLQDRGCAGCCWGGGTRNGVWHAPQASRPNVATVAVTAAPSFAIACSRNVAERFSRFFAAASNSGHFC